MQTARDLMVKEFVTISHDASIIDAVKKMRALELDTGRVDVRCLVVLDAEGTPKALLTEADLIQSILPRFFRERRFSDFISKWLNTDLPEASLAELFEELTARARKKTVQDLVSPHDLVTIDPGASLVKVAYTLHIDKIKTLPVSEDGRIVGIVYRGAVFDAVSEKILAVERADD